MTTTTTLIPIGRIVRDGGTRTRAAVRPEVVAEYADDYKAGDEFPEVVLFTEDDESFQIGDGEHRIEARIKAGFEDVEADVRPGGRREAILFSAGSNRGKGHGLRRSNEDKRRAVAMLLADPEWTQKSDRWIADQCRVSHDLVAEVRAVKPSENNGQETEEEDSFGDSAKRTGRRGGTGTGPKARKCEKCKRLKLNNPSCPQCVELRTAKDRKKAEAAAAKAKKAKEQEEKRRKAAQDKTDRAARKQAEKAERERKAAEAKAAKEREKADKEAKKEAERKAREAAKKPGRPTFDDRKITDAVSKLARLFSDRANALGQLKSPAYKAVRDGMETTLQAWQAWRKGGGE